ncbi:hypothetical protein WAK64_19800 [Bacillus spongiae]|uniref:Uncharacterized protein n=1 Tax=Bacillus spongiae TaxID=2683610 RepID=A0ABU8HJG2_9BACI
MRIYLPPLFCGENAKLRLKKNLEWRDLFIQEGEICTVKETIGYTHVLIFNNLNVSHRMKNSIMKEYFDIMDEGVKDWIEPNTKLIREAKAKIVTLKKDLVIKGYTTIEEGKEFYPIDYQKHDGRKYWNLYDATTKERILNLRDDDFTQYFM